MLAGTGLYTLALTRNPDPVIAMEVLGGLVVAATALVAWHLPREPEPWPTEGRQQQERKPCRELIGNGDFAGRCDALPSGATTTSRVSGQRP